MTRILIAITSALLMAACSMTYSEPSLTPNHPASPEGASAPLPERSQTLAIGEETPAPSSATPAVPAAGAHQHMHGEPEHAAPSPAAAAAAPSPSAPSAALYECPMHLEVTADKPDQRCPKCGMKLVKKGEGGEKR